MEGVFKERRRVNGATQVPALRGSGDLDEATVFSFPIFVLLSLFPKEMLSGLVRYGLGWRNGLLMVSIHS